MLKKELKSEFFNRDTKTVAKELLGKFLVAKMGNKEVALMITETEAYDGFDDKASHASKGKTERTKIMFEKPGVFYVYLVYGMYFMLNVVTREKDYPAAVLIRGAGDFLGPGKLTKFLKINKNLNGKVANKKTGVWLEDRGVVVKSSEIKKFPRVGVNYSGPVWSAKKWRFSIQS